MLKSNSFRWGHFPLWLGDSSISLPSSYCLFSIACKSKRISTAEIYLSWSHPLLAWGVEWGMDWMHAFQVSICFLKSLDETKVIPYSKIKRWKKGQRHTIVINKTKSACTCTGCNTINNIGKNLAWKYVPGKYFVSSSRTRHNSGESNLHYSALDLERPSSSINGPDTGSIWGVIWSWWTFTV